jgi:hypothetical protein
MVNEVKADVNVLKVNCNTSITDIKELRRILLSLNGGGDVGYGFASPGN